MRGLIKGVVTGGFVSVAGLATLSVMNGRASDGRPAEAASIDSVAPQTALQDSTPQNDAPQIPAGEPRDQTPSTPVGSVSIAEPVAPSLPGDQATLQEPDPAPIPSVQTDVSVVPDVPVADTSPLAAPNVSAIEGAMQAPDAPEATGVVATPVAPVVPNRQALAPQAPTADTGLTVSTTPADPQMDIPEEPAVADAPQPAVVFEAPVIEAPVFEVPADPNTDTSGDDILASAAPSTVRPPRIELRGDGNAMPGSADTGVTIRRFDDPVDPNVVAPPAPGALALYAAATADVGETPVMSIILVDDGSMSAPVAALANVPFAVTIALDPNVPDINALMSRYRAARFEVVALAKLPEGAQASDVEITYQSVFQTLPETIAVLDIGEAGLQSDRDVTDQAMAVLASQGLGFIRGGQGLNMAARAAQKLGVPVIDAYRDLDFANQDARVMRRFIDQAAFRARQESGVVLVGHVRPDTISALILWGSANLNSQVAVVPVSAILKTR